MDALPIDALAPRLYGNYRPLLLCRLSLFTWRGSGMQNRGPVSPTTDSNEAH